MGFRWFKMAFGTLSMLALRASKAVGAVVGPRPRIRSFGKARQG